MLFKNHYNKNYLNIKYSLKKYMSVKIDICHLIKNHLYVTHA